MVRSLSVETGRTKSARLRWDRYRRTALANFNEKTDRADCARKRRSEAITSCAALWETNACFGGEARGDRAAGFGDGGGKGAVGADCTGRRCLRYLRRHGCSPWFNYGLNRPSRWRWELL